MSIQDVLALIDQWESAVLFVAFLAILAARRRVVAWLRHEMGVDSLRADVLRVTLLHNIHSAPHKAEVIEEDWKEYAALGGNGYMANVIEEWRASHESELIAKRLGTWDGIERRGQRQKNKGETDG
jgi:hypothetical protein